MNPADTPPTVHPESGAIPRAAYPPGAAGRLLATDLVTPKTRDVLLRRLQDDDLPDDTPPRFFTPEEYATLQAACARLVPQPGRVRPVDLARPIDDRLAAGLANGWRYDAMPPDREAFRQGLRGLHETAAAISPTADGSGGMRFESLDPDGQDAVLAAVQSGEAAGPVWTTLSPPLFFEELLIEVVSIYYSHPLAWDEIGYAGFADAHGWRRIGLNRLDPFEPRPATVQPGDDHA